MRSVSGILLFMIILFAGTKLPAPYSCKNNDVKARKYYGYARSYNEKAAKAVAAGNSRLAAAYRQCAQCKKTMARYFEGKSSKSEYIRACSQYKCARADAEKYRKSGKSSEKCKSKSYKKGYYVKDKSSWSSNKNGCSKNSTAQEKFDRFQKRFNNSPVGGQNFPAEPARNKEKKLAERYDKQYQALRYYAIKMKKLGRLQKAAYYKDLALTKKKIALAYESGNQIALRNAFGEYRKVKNNYSKYINKKTEGSKARPASAGFDGKISVDYIKTLGDNKL
ncbi:hypothetical protein P0136_00935 [Lentisphaerota bacterium ZTH]|nr:hypothetical protein JYG24_07925 [Lentisphaerota bacterium]WET06578.1 hypothetical protein P0136_00935 [Lentisphaerota bacterium ZTH]